MTEPKELLPCREAFEDWLACTFGEVNRLKDQFDDYDAEQQHCWEAWQEAWNESLQSAQAEIARLRAALTEIANDQTCEINPNNYSLDDVEAVDMSRIYMIKRATEALATGEPNGTL